LIALASGDEYLKQAILRFTVEHFKEDLRKMLGLVPTTIKLTWDQGFEEFLRERKKRMKIKSEGTMKYYRNLFKKHLEGKVLSQVDEEIIDPIIDAEDASILVENTIIERAIGLTSLGNR
jgi:hypothetical protein